MPASAPTLPDIRRATAALLVDKTDAGERSSHEPRRNPKLPRIIVEHGGDIQQSDIRVPRGRVILNCYGNSPDEARRVAYQAHDVLMPPANVVWGYHGLQDYVDEEGLTRTLKFSGAQLESGPREAADSRTRVITSYLVDYYDPVNE